MEDIILHHDGHGLNESLKVTALDGIGPGNSHHLYAIYAEDGTEVTRIQFQQGPRNEEGSTAGATTAAVVAILIHHLQGFQTGAYSSRETALVITKLQEANHWTRERADERARRSVLGQYAK